MVERHPQTGSKTAAIIFALFAVACVVAFLANRGSDIGQLPKLIGDLGGGPLFGMTGFQDSIVGIIAALLIGISWFGLGNFALSYFRLAGRERHSMILDVAIQTAAGAAIWSLAWFFLGIAGAYAPIEAALAVVLGVTMSLYHFRRILRESREMKDEAKLVGYDYLLAALIAVPIVLALVASLAPPLAKDTLLYHFSVPKAFIVQGSNSFVEGNIASFLALGTEMHIVWAMLLGGMVSTRAGEAAAGATVFLFFPLLIAVVYGWARELTVSRRWSMVAASIVATVPTAFHVAASGYVDVTLALFVTLGIYSLCRWWTTQAYGWLILIGIFLGAALSIKVTSVFVVAAFALIVLLRARNSVAPGSDSVAATNSGRIVATGFAALLLAGVIASPWYIRTWAATGSPVFPFYMSILPGKANGWDAERSGLFQSMNSQYGGVDMDKINLLTAPVRVSVAAQPEVPANYDGVLGIAFLLGLPLLIWALWKFDLPVEAKIGAGVVGVMYLFWLFSSEQLRYLLPIVPVLAIAIAASVESITKKAGTFRTVAQYAFTVAALAGALTLFAWFCQKAPLRVVLGGESREQYLTRNLDYYPYYQQINTDTATDAKVWLINMRRDTYNIQRSVFSDYLFEDWTLRKLVWESRSVQELKARAAAMNVQYVLTRHDFLFDYDRSTLVDDKKPRTENDAKLKIAKDFILDPANTVRADNKFSLIKVF